MQYQYLELQKKKLDNLYNDLIECLNNSIYKVETLKTRESKFSELKTDFISSFTENVKIAKAQMISVKNNVIWDHLVIAFFGETNAGKSTLIETFRICFNEKSRKNKLDRLDHPNFMIKFFRYIKKIFRKKDDDMYQYGIDGDIVGDGSPDFTKQHTEYELNIDDCRFTLIDVPGIEGNEKLFHKDVQDALLKAHCVFYVQGHNKQPDEATAIKIKKYLNEWVSVYAIYNVRSNAEQYLMPSDRKSLKSPNVRQVEGLIQNTFSRLLGKNFKGILCTQGLLSLCSHARFSKKHDDLIRKQKKLIQYFGSVDNLWKFSQFEDLKNAVKYMGYHYLDEIIEANKLKYIKVSHDIIININHTIQEEQDKLDSFRNSLDRFVDGIQSKLNNTKLYINSDVNAIIDETFTNLRKDIFDCIEEGKTINSSNLQTRTKSQIKKGIDQSLKNRINNLNQDIMELKKDLDNNDEISINNIVIKPEIPSINLDDAMSELDIKWSDVFSVGSTIAGGAIAGSVFGPIGAAIGGALGIAVGIIKSIFGDGGKGKAKAKASEELYKAQGVVRNNLNSLIIGIENKLDNNIEGMTNILNQEIKNLDFMRNEIDDLKKEIKIKANNLKNSHYGTI